jgi:predicted acetyltransferase
MDISVLSVSKDEKDILRNLLEKYTYEFSQYENNDVNDFGLYGYTYLDHYWTDEKRFAYFIKVNKKLAGFVMINNYKEAKLETDYTMAEFFVMYKYRKTGIGTYAAKYIFDKYKGKWQLKYHTKNIGSKIFWNKVVDEYTNGRYEIMKDNIESKYDDGTKGEVIIFDT